MDKILQTLLEKVADLHGVPEGAYNIRANGQMAGRNTTANIDIVTREDGKGIDVHIKPGTKKESVHIPVILSQTGLNETVCNDFFVGDDADVTIIAGCGIHNGGDMESRHDGIHRFFVGKNAKLKYVEKHYGDGDGERPDQGRGLHKEGYGGPSGSRGQAGGPGASHDPWAPGCGEPV